MNARPPGDDKVEPRKFNILLVDDRPENLVALEAALVDLGQNVVKARSGKDALRHLLNDDFVVILLDVNMPEMDGLETAALIRQRRRSQHTPIIFVTAAMSAGAELARGYALGAVDYLFIPIDPEILRAKVAAFIELERKADLLRRRAEDDRAVAERRAARLESRLQSLFNRLDVGIFRSTLDGRLIDANPAMLRLLGVRSIEEVRDQPGRADEARASRQLFSYHVDGEPLQVEVVRFVHQNGNPVHVSVTKTLNEGLDGETFVEGLATDISARMQAAEEREHLLASERAARSDAERANRMKDEFLATLSHELRTPLQAILGWSEVLRQPRSDPQETLLGLETIERNARVQIRLIDDLLDMSRIMSGKIRLDLQRVTLATLIDGVVESFQPAILAKGIRLHREFDPKCESVSADPARLQQVVWNLLSNAVKFTPRSGAPSGEGTVKVLVQPAGAFVQISVVDDGQGIRPEFLPQVFGRFRQADASSTRQHSGLGLGLAIVKHLVEMHGGTIRAHSEGVDLGARFDVLLPFASASTPEPPSAVPSSATESNSPERELAERTSLAGIRVLVVDDVADARELMRRVLEERGAEVRTAESATSALELIQRDPPDVLISDIGMPDFDGYYLIERIRSRAPPRSRALPAVAVTSFARTEDRQRALLAGFNEHLIKPIESWRLIQAVFKLAKRPIAEERQESAGR